MTHPAAHREHDAVTPRLLAVARGDEPADVLLVGARVVNVFERRLSDRVNIAIAEGRIAGVGDYTRGRVAIDLARFGAGIVAPGFIDAHMHVESTMLPPSQFVRLASPHGTTGAVFDPHEIANVLGVPGIRWVMEDARALPFTALFALSSCVPSSPLETSGATISADDLAPLFDDPRVVSLAEMMNYPGVVSADPGVLAKVNLGLARRMVDGHAPGLRAKALQAYVAAGISSDHECTTADEAAEKLALGLRIFIREGSAARNLESLLPLVRHSNAHRFCFCTDDRHPGDLQDAGHIDHVVRRAIALGLDPLLAFAIGSHHAAVHYRRRDLGAIAPGYWANLLVLDELETVRPRLVMHEGHVAARDGEYVFDGGAHGAGARSAPPTKPLRLPAALTAASFRIPAGAEHRLLRVIGMNPHQLVTASLRMHAKIVDGAFVADTDQDVLKLAVIERHTGSGRIGLGFAHGFGIKAGAIASTVGHDSHNLAVLGANDADMLVAAHTLASCGGGQCVVRDGQVLEVLPLPIAGLMSDQPAESVVRQQHALLKAARTLGYPHHDPFMPLSFLPLPVIPHLKLTDLGLVDVDQFKVVPLEA